MFVRLHEVIRENAHKLYPGMRLTAPTLFRLTRDAEVEIDEHADQGVRELVREQIRQRRYEPVVRLEFAASAAGRIRQTLQERFGLTPEDVYDLPGELDYTSLFQIAGLDVPELRDAPWTPATPARLGGDANIFDVIRAGDLLVHHPYDSFDDSVERFISTAAEDSRTIAIKMTVYRVGDDTPFVRSLIRAAEAGKQVACVIELKARFDEERNLHWAAELERAGAHVTVGDVTSEDPREGRAGRSEGGRRSAGLRPHRHRQLPRQDGAALHRCRPADVRSRADGGRRATSSTISPDGRTRPSSRSSWSPRRRCGSASWISSPARPSISAPAGPPASSPR